MTAQPQQYIIDDDDLAIWRTGCINWRSREDTKCYGCEYAGVESRKGCCEFDDDEMQKIFQSRPATVPSQELLGDLYWCIGRLKQATCDNPILKPGDGAVIPRLVKVAKSLRTGGEP